jgi:hypothetical protein
MSTPKLEDGREYVLVARRQDQAMRANCYLPQEALEKMSQVLPMAFIDGGQEYSVITFARVGPAVRLVLEPGNVDDFEAAPISYQLPASPEGTGSGG